jgi:hypothetical protein
LTLKKAQSSDVIDPKLKITEPKQEKLSEPQPKKEEPPKEEINSQNPEIEIVDENQKKLDEIFKDSDKTSKYDFNLHKHLKENLKLKDKQCKDGLTKDTLYCLECKLSTCPKCPLFKVHNGHPLVNKYPYYCMDNNIINENFKEIDTIIEINPSFLDSNKVKEELKKLVIDNLEILQNKINEVKQTKLQELDSLFEQTENCAEKLKTKIVKIKKDIKLFLEKQKKFFCIDLTENVAINQNNPEAKEVIQNLQVGSKSNAELISANTDELNSTFLITYDLLKNAKNINEQIKYFMNDIKVNREKYITDFTSKKNVIYEDILKLLNFDGSFNYQFLDNEFYKIINEKIQKYNDRIENMKRKIMDKVNKKGNFEDLDRENKMANSKINLDFDNILNNQLIDEDEAKTIISKSKKTNKKSTSGSKGPIYPTPKSGIKNTGTNVESTIKTISIPEKIYNNADEVKLDNAALQNFFAYEALNVVNENFKLKKKNKNEEAEIDFIEEIELAKPIPGKAEIQVYDRKSRNIVRKNVKFEKNRHKYLNFLTGCRSVLVKDKLYILGGVDKENNTTNVAWVYYIKENDLKPMPDMIHNHAYHTAQFLEYYKSIIVIGGENCVSCELYDLKTGKWRELPDMKIPRANSIVYLDKITHKLYSFFGILGKIAEKNNNYSDVIECLQFRKLALGWQKLEYNNRTDISFRTGINQMLPLNPEMILVYGGSSMREFIKQSAVFILHKNEMAKIDNRMFNEIRKASKKSRRLSIILSTVE